MKFRFFVVALIALVGLSIDASAQSNNAPVILSGYFNDATMGCSYSNVLVATNGAQPYTWALGDGSVLPPGLVLDSSGVISGTPQTDNLFNFTVQCTGADSNVVTGTIYFTVNGPLTVEPSTLPFGSVGVSYFGSLYSYGGAQPQMWSIVSGALPPGLEIDPVTGYISGAPTSVGVFEFTLRVADSCTAIDTPLAITNYQALQFITTTLPVGQPSAAYNAQFEVTGGLPPYGFLIYGSFPDDLTGNPDGSITGVTYYESTNTVTCYVYDSAGNSIQQDFTLIITAQPMVAAPSLDLPAADGGGFTFRVNGSSGQAYTLQSTVDLTNWTDVVTTNAPADVFFMTDTNAIDGMRYYRLRAAQ